MFWQLLLDGILLSAVAFAGAVPLAWGIVRAVRASLMAGLVLSTFPDVTPDAGVLAATALLTLVIGLAMGVVSAWQSVAARVDECLRRGRGSIGSFGRFGRGLLVAQVALSMTCLVGAGLFTATLARLRANDTSLQSQRIVFTRAYREPGDRQLLPPEYYQTLVADLGHMPGAEAAALSVYYPTYFHVSGPLPTEHYTRADGVAAPEVAVLPEFVSPGFFDLFRLPRLQGRDISWDDGPGKPAVALVSASLARALFPAGDAVGRHIRLAGPERRDVEVIGVVGDAPYGKLDDPRPFVVFRPILQDLARSQFPMAYVRRERRPRDGARWIHARREGAGASVAARVHDVIRICRQCAAAAAFHGRVGHICSGHHDPAGMHGRVRAARVLRRGAGSRNRCAPGAWRGARDRRLDDRAGRSGDRGARCARRRCVRVVRRAARTGTTLRHRPR